jgi:cell division protein FtsZ
MRPDNGHRLARESSSIVEEALLGADMVVIAACMGKGTGTGSTPVIARAAQSFASFTAAIVSTPFSYEGRKCHEIAINGIEVLSEHVDTLIIFPNEKIEQIFKDDSMVEWLQQSDNVIAGLTKAIASIAFFDHSFFSPMDPLERMVGRHLFEAMGSGTATDVMQIRAATQQALSSSFFSRFNPSVADIVLLNIRSGSILSYKQVLSAIVETRTFFGPSIPILKSMDYVEDMGETVGVFISALSRVMPHQTISPRAA